MKLAVDAWNLADDRRGMGRYTRRVLADWQTVDDLEVTLLVRKVAEARALAEEFTHGVHVGTDVTADAVWYPWNAMRFDVRGASSVVLLHDAFAFTHPHREWIARWREQHPIRRAVERATVLSSSSDWSAGELARVFHRDPRDFHVIRPVPDPFWTPAPSDDRDAYVLVVSGSETRKNLPTLIKAFARAFPARDVALRIVGSMSDSDARILEQANIRHTRVRPNDDELRTLYSNALAVAAPSSAEGYGFMTVEAMACGAPVVASDAAALPEACDGAAMLVPPFDLDAWALALERLAGDAALRQSMREQSRARIARIDRSEPARATAALLRAAREAQR